MRSSNVRVRDASVTEEKETRKKMSDTKDGGKRKRDSADRSSSANNVFVYSTHVVMKKITILVYVHQYLDSSRKPN